MERTTRGYYDQFIEPLNAYALQPVSKIDMNKKLHKEFPWLSYEKDEDYITTRIDYGIEWYEEIRHMCYELKNYFVDHGMKLNTLHVYNITSDDKHLIVQHNSKNTEVLQIIKKNSAVNK